ncbi:type II toxin-antitoxin system PemK/MazF family toxin [Lacticaseibacillus casei]|jgi:mRNA interferase MazF|uniref:Cell growth regulatory protein n=1 Tax=Lacticaseibacillus paracasei subsp. paracasei Lpp123 TaxID=1256201 RepID=A0A829GLP5_LACPA|nr:MULTISPECIES: type II toxin-antitoxin system PemK/MazF family toxin [Lacticaseibacillus]EPC59511.1 cell growth regulatory protein [Lacticaseibacillus paracasei subsp. paracasei Lpp123]QVI38555.1 type II toxin-antitoxin system PemK/MazF family toxin [Lacticaseibacillus casei]WFB42566.1 type II toxin-antitoxin system PemK/MazF family toxin [Lacticaseibacillus huelsenbergensis]CAD7482809.1 mRNA interferase MazF [Lacticaseibacillus paracasei]
MVEKTLIIEQGKIYWIDAEPHAGREEGGHSPRSGNIRRPVLVISNNRYNVGGMALVFPITSIKKMSRYLLPLKLKKPSQIILTQILGYDMVARRAKPSGFSVTSEQLDYLKQIVVHSV